MSEQQNQVKSQLEKLKEAEEEKKQKEMEEKLKEVEEKLKETEEKREELEQKAKSTIQAIQQKIDNIAKEMANRNAEHQKRTQELEIEKKLALKSVGDRFLKEIHHLEAENWEMNARFAEEMSILKVQLKDKINWNQADLVMDEKIRNPLSNRWERAPNDIIFISREGLYAQNNNKIATVYYKSVYAEKAFIISVDFPGSVLYYFEAAIKSTKYKGEIIIGLSSGTIPDGSFVGEVPNSYAIEYRCDYCWISGKTHQFEWPNGALKPEWKAKGDVLGCGLLLEPEHKLSIFFTGNGILMGKPIPINPTVDYLYPTVSMYGFGSGSIKANFGDKSAKPFNFDVKKFVGMAFK